MSLAERFDRSVRDHPDRLALVCGGEDLTYGALDEAVGAMAGHLEPYLARRPEGAPGRVGLATSRTPATYACYLAVQRLGATAVPVNPRLSATRNAAVLAAAGVDVLCVDASTGHARADLIEQVAAPVADLGDGAWRRAGQGPRRDPARVAYLCFTSGSTGRPKGVPVSQESVTAFIDHMIPLFGFTASSRVAQTFELSFDAALNELYGAWAAGGALYVATHAQVFDPVAFVADHELTHWLSVPSLVDLARAAGTLEPGALPHLRHVIVGGEQFTPAQARTWREAAPAATVHNGYGPTELALLCTALSIAPGEPLPTDGAGTIPIGSLFPGLQAVLADVADDGTVGVDADTGELCVRGVQRFAGYLDPADDRGRFIAADGDGHRLLADGETISPEHFYRTGDRVARGPHGFVHLGRVDDQVKIAGFRVEPSEVEALLAAHPDLTSVAVVAAARPGKDGAPGVPRLHALYTATDDIGRAEFVELVAALPLYLRPDTYTRLERMPLSPHGKVDRRALAGLVATARP
ncbi:amino acid adenylation domain-containing protein [Jatrophihabitans endophyticus]|uniref:Amino acid adenylation domain-containing protein n=1 Tax=Jatrophihabitans endophyticus TaxID=1206085 RepID=A0A1M5CNL8_9ACTN|nr:AMP-binding protein [Jatrophihabitans endophyticus]SHF56299.1 amino acid adenylation domain-containing protein [Jatrophihabitans endophyticus]